MLVYLLNSCSIWFLLGVIWKNFFSRNVVSISSLMLMKKCVFGCFFDFKLISWLMLMVVSIRYIMINGMFVIENFLCLFMILFF